MPTFLVIGGIALVGAALLSWGGVFLLSLPLWSAISFGLAWFLVWSGAMVWIGTLRKTSVLLIGMGVVLALLGFHLLSMF
ncbi:MAG: hypothetical protein ABSD99_01750 [Candidatus Bathyarchaeia archaeon]|jgi:hypothetical protein